jgi:TPR repeat protein
VVKDYNEAVKQYRMAADLGYAEAQYNLGLCYIKGTSVVQDKAEALRWFVRAANQGFEPAKEVLRVLEK